MSPPRPVIEFYPTKPDTDLTTFIKPSNRLRESFELPFYHCLPLVTANTLGWTVLNRFDFSVVWRGGKEASSVTVECEQEGWVAGTIGYGTFTIFPGFIVKTPPGINLLVRPVPNIYKHNVQTLEGFVETDWMRNTFTLNFRVQMPIVRTSYKAGEPLVQLVPYGRHFIEQFDAKIVNSGTRYDEMMADFDVWRERRRELIERQHEKLMQGLELTAEDYSSAYRRGEDIHGNKFPDHVKILRVSELKVDE